MGLVSTYRYNGEEVNARLASSEADILHEAIKDKAFNNEEVIRILSTRSKAQLNATFNHYRDVNKTSITKVYITIFTPNIFFFFFSVSFIYLLIILYLLIVDFV